MDFIVVDIAEKIKTSNRRLEDIMKSSFSSLKTHRCQCLKRTMSWFLCTRRTTEQKKLFMCTQKQFRLIIWSKCCLTKKTRLLMSKPVNRKSLIWSSTTKKLTLLMLQRVTTYCKKSRWFVKLMRLKKSWTQQTLKIRTVYNLVLEEEST